MRHNTLRIVRWGVIGLIALMPFHAFLSVWLGTSLGHRELIQAWKEILLLLMGMGVTWLLVTNRDLRKRLHTPWIYWLFAYTVFSLIVTAINRPPIEAIALGVKYNLGFLLACAIAFVVSSPKLEQLTTKIILATSAVVALFALAQVWLLPRDFLARFGYSASTIEPFRLVDPAVEAVRVLSTLGGPNQLGSFIILPLCLTIFLAIKRLRWWQLPIIATLIVALLGSYSRSAWIGAAVAVTILLTAMLPTKWRVPAAGATIVTIGIGLMLAVQNPDLGGGKLQYYLFHVGGRHYEQSGSDAERIDALKRGLQTVADHPWGRGLGTAGPASQVNDNALITENYYLQIAAEVGVMGLILFLALQISVSARLWHRRGSSPMALPLLATLAGVSVINLFLHGWADSSTALVWWATAGVSLGSANG